MAASRTKVAAATAAIVPFNCVICFEEFNLKSRVPVVLPCGHTFVCEPCSKRLKRCMECRVPLYYTIPKKTQAMVSYNRGGGRYSPTPLTPPQMTSTISTQPQQKQQMPLPIPKNLVLVAMMEAAKLQTIKRENLEEEREDQSQGRCDVEAESDSGNDTEEELDMKDVLSGLDMLTGPCGTYAATESLGFTPAYELELSANEPIREMSSTTETRDFCTLEKGSTVQVVGFEDGSAKLARGFGYIAVESSSLVKVGGPLDNCCRLEGLLKSVSEKSEDLRLELERNLEIEARLKEEIAKESDKEPNHPIITFPPIEEEDALKDLENKHVETGPTTPTDVRTIDDINVPILKPETPRDSVHLGLRLQSTILDLDDTEMRDFSHHGVGDPMAFPFCVSPDRLVGATSLPHYRRTGSSDSLNELGYGCTAFLGAGAHLFAEGETSNENHLLRGLEAHDSRARSSSDGEQQQLQPAFTSSFDTIDFRTGLSGHRGLQNTHSAHSPTPRGRAPTRYLMSVHDGIGSHSHVHNTSKRHSPPGQIS